MSVLIFGGRGFMGKHLKTIYPDATLPETDIADPAQVAAVLDREKPAIVINAAGKTGDPNVDWCEEHKDETVRSNVSGPLVLLGACRTRGIYWVHIGSGCIYQGGTDRAFTEDDPPNFNGSFYARTKSWTDQILKDFPVLQLRLRMPFDGSDHPRNLIMKLRRYAKILDVQNSITYLPDFLSAAKILIDRRRIGIYNVVNPGTISPYQIMERFAKQVDPRVRFERLTIDHLPDVVRAGRSNCILSTKKLLNEGIALQSIEQALAEAFAQTKKRAHLSVH